MRIEQRVSLLGLPRSICYISSNRKRNLYRSVVHREMLVGFGGIVHLESLIDDRL